MLHEAVCPPATLNNGPTERCCAMTKPLVLLVRQPGKALQRIAGWRTNRTRGFVMAQHRSVGPLFSVAGGQTVSWSISYGTGQDVGIVTAAPNIIDDVLGVVLLQAQN